MLVHAAAEIVRPGESEDRTEQDSLAKSNVPLLFSFSPLFRFVRSLFSFQMSPLSVRLPLLCDFPTVDVNYTGWLGARALQAKQAGLRRRMRRNENKEMLWYG